MTDQQNPFSNMPEPPAAPDPARRSTTLSARGRPRNLTTSTKPRSKPTTPTRPRRSNPTAPARAMSPYQAQAQQSYQATYEQPQPAYQQVYAQPVAPAAPAALYPMTDTDRNLRLVAFIFCILSLVGSCWLIIPLAWMIPMSVISWGIYKGSKANTVAFDVCTLIFCSLVAGILLLCSNKDR